MASQFASRVHYLTVSVYTKTTIHLGVGGYLIRCFGLGKYPLLATDTEVNSC